MQESEVVFQFMLYKSVTLNYLSPWDDHSPARELLQLIIGILDGSLCSFK